MMGRRSERHAWLRFTREGFRLAVANDLTVKGGAGRLELSGIPGCTNGVGESWKPSAGAIYFSLLENGPEVNVGDNLILANGGILSVLSAATNGVAPDYGALVSVTNDVLIFANSWIEPWSHGTNGGSVLLRTRNLAIPEANAGINANYRGYMGNIWVNIGKGSGPGRSKGAANAGGVGHGEAGDGAGGTVVWGWTAPQGTIIAIR